MLNERERALTLTESALKIHPDSKELIMMKAFLLFHIAIDPAVKINDTQKEEMLSKAEDIYKAHLDDQDEKVRLDSRHFLTQMLAIARDKKAADFAEENYKNNPCALMANRLFDVYLRLGNFEEAKRAFAIYEDHGEKEGIPPVYMFLDRVTFYKAVGDKKKADEAKSQGLGVEVSSKEEIAAKEMLRDM